MKLHHYALYMFSELKSTFVLTFVLVTFSISSSFSLTHAAIDSVGVEKVNGQSFIIHEVDPQETLFGISRRYSSPVGDIINANPVLKSGLKIGQSIRVPFIPAAAIPEGAKLHNVGAGETLFSISKTYEVTVDELKEWNGLIGNDLSIGQGLIIKNVAQPKVEEPQPVIEPVAVVAATTSTTVTKATPKAEKAQEKVTPKNESKAAEEPKKEIEKQVEKLEDAAQPALTGKEKPMVPGEWMSHTVASGETLFSIANQYEARVEDLITWNALSSNNVKVGQTLKVGRGPMEESTVPVYGQPKVVSSLEEADESMNVGASSGGFKNIKETGKAELIEGTGSHKKYLVLHRTAPIGTIMRVKNEENDVTIFARVVGTLPETGDNSSLLIKLSQAAFDQLKAINGRFPVEIMY